MRLNTRWVAALMTLLAWSVLVVPESAAQPPAASEADVDAVGIEPPPPVPPRVIARDAEGRATVRAVRLAEPLVIDGVLNDAAYASNEPFGDFVQQEPRAGAPATERSEVWVFFDDRNLYVSARFWKSDPTDLVANELRKDDSGIFRNDCIGVVLDTFRDRRTGYYFNTNALGAVRDGLLVNENQNANLDFNPVWDVRSHRFDKGWSTEMVIPFRSLRYPEGVRQVWGILVQRIDWQKNEFSYLTPIPPSWGGAGIWKVSSAATLVGIEAPPRSSRLELKPYMLSSAAAHQSGAAAPTELSADVGIDARYRLTSNLNADFTYNTDFAQVEVDNQQLNLSRFSLFFPEKREFFLEMQNTMNAGVASGPGGGRSPSDPTPILYFSRRIGLIDGVNVPIVAGGRLLGRAGDQAIGAFTIRTAASERAGSPGTTFTVGRVRRNLFRRSAIGGLVTHRLEADGSSRNYVAAFDAQFRFYENVELNGYVASSGGAPSDTGDRSFLGQFRYTGDRYGLEASRLHVGSAFDAGIGFVPRRGVNRTFVSGRFSPRPRALPSIRKFSWEGSLDHITNASGGTDTLLGRGIFRIQQSSGDELNADLTRTEDHPRTAFTVAGVPIAPGTYRFTELRLNYVLGPQRPAAGTITAARGGFYGGEKTEVGFNGRLSPVARLMLEPAWTWSSLRMPSGPVDAQLIGLRTTLALTPRMFAAALVQYNSTVSAVGANLRFRWEYRPGSDFFVVYSEGRETSADTRRLDRSLAVKFTRFFQM